MTLSKLIPAAKRYCSSPAAVSDRQRRVIDRGAIEVLAYCDAPSRFNLIAEKATVIQSESTQNREGRAAATPAEYGSLIGMIKIEVVEYRTRQFAVNTAKAAVEGDRTVVVIEGPTRIGRSVVIEG